MQEKRTTAQNNLSDFIQINLNTKQGSFPGKYTVSKLNRLLTSSCTLIRVRVNDEISFPWLFATRTFPQVVGVKHTAVKNLKWRREILFGGHAVHGRHTGEFCHIQLLENLV